MRIAESFCKMRLSEYCTSQDIDRAIAVTVDSFVGSQKVSCKKALARAFAKYVTLTSCDCYARASITLLIMRTRYTLARPGAAKKWGGQRGYAGTAAAARA
jgi:DNA replication licensing factor MCM2